MTSAVITATYADIKTVKTRGVFQIVFEGPIEQMGAAMDILGAPIASREVWVAIALLKTGAAEARGGKLAQQAGILCGQGAFDRLAHETGHADGKAMIYALCGVTSRRDLDHDEAAGAKFRDLKADYEMWLKDVAA